MSLVVALAVLAAAQPFPDRGAVTNPYDYRENAAWSAPPVEGFRTVYGDPQALVGALSPREPATPAAAPVGVMPVVEGPGDPSAVTQLPMPKPRLMARPHEDLVVVNPASGWAEIAIGEDRLGVLGPLATGRLHGVRAGTYAIRFTLSSGYSWEQTVKTEAPLEKTP